MQKGTELGNTKKNLGISRDQTKPERPRTKNLGNNTTPSSLTMLIIELNDMYHIFQRARRTRQLDPLVSQSKEGV